MNRPTNGSDDGVLRTGCVALKMSHNADKKRREQKSHVILSTSRRSLLLIYRLPCPSCAVTLLLLAVCISLPAGLLSSGKVPFR